MTNDNWTGESFTIYLVSDGTCRTCAQVVRAVLVQFSQVNIKQVKKAQVRSPELAREIIAEAAQQRALVFYTLVEDHVRRAIQEAARELMVPLVDVLGPVLTGLYDLVARAPRAKPGILYAENKAHFDRVDAVEYTLHHDDGVGVHELADADVVIIGVSRACKSTTCFYLGYSGIRAANVPLVPGCDVPPEVLQVDQRRVIGLTSNPHRLQTIREARLRGWGMDLHDEYGDRRHIAQELRTANELMQKHGWKVIDTSYKAIEEIAREIIQTLEDAGVGPVERQD